MKPNETLNNATREKFKQIWRALFRCEPPEDGQWSIWGRRHTASVIRSGLMELAGKDRKMSGVMEMDHRIRYMSAIMNAETRAQQEALDRLKFRHNRQPVAVGIGDQNTAEADESRWNR